MVGFREIYEKKYGPKRPLLQVNTLSRTRIRHASMSHDNPSSKDRKLTG